VAWPGGEKTIAICEGLWAPRWAFFQLPFLVTLMV
jgi:hypothetical protein